MLTSEPAPLVTLRELQALVAISELGSFRRAAARLGYTQSALSHQVATLERKLGRRLLVRPGGRGAVRLTPAGDAACSRGRRALGETEAILADIEATERGERLQIRVGVSQSTASEVMPAALRAFRELHPGVEVILNEVDGDEAVLVGLARGKLDLGFVRTLEPDERAELVHISEDPWVLVTRRDSALAALEDPGMDALDGTEVVAWTLRWRAQRSLEELWSRLGVTPRIVYRTDDNLALQRLVASGLGDACVGYLSVRRLVDASL